MARIVDGSNGGHRASGEKSTYREEASPLSFSNNPNPHTICHYLPVSVAIQSLASRSPYVLEDFATCRNPTRDVVEGDVCGHFDSLTIIHPSF